MPKQNKAVKKKRTIKTIISKKKIIPKKSNLEGDIKEPEEAIEKFEFKEFLSPQKTSAPSLNKVLIQEPLETNIIPFHMEDTIKTEENSRGIYTSSKNFQKYSPEVVAEKEENKYQDTPESDFFNPTRFEEKRATGLAQEINPLETEIHQTINPQVGSISKNNSFEEEKKYKEGEF